MKKSWPQMPVLLTERFCDLCAVSANLLASGVLMFTSCISAAINSIVSQFSFSFTARPIQAVSLCKTHTDGAESPSGFSSVVDEESIAYQNHSDIANQKVYMEGTLMKKFLTVMILLTTLVPLSYATLER